MSKYIEDAEGNFIADSNRGTITYADAMNKTMNRFYDNMNLLIANLQDDITYLAKEEALEPSEGNDA